MDHNCTTCKQPKDADEIFDKENHICEDCYNKWFDAENAYWRPLPLYDGEVLGGFYRPKENGNDN